jgi:hypothetical protein
MILQKMKIPTLKEFRNDRRNNGISWFDAYGRMCCEECQKTIQPGEIVLYAGSRRVYHLKCAPKEDLK